MVSDAAIRLARRYVWWQEPAETLLDVRHLLRQIMALGRPEDYTRHIADNTARFGEVIRRARIKVE